MSRRSGHGALRSMNRDKAETLLAEFDEMGQLGSGVKCRRSTSAAFSGREADTVIVRSRNPPSMKALLLLRSPKVAWAGGSWRVRAGPQLEWCRRGGNCLY